MRKVDDSPHFGLFILLSDSRMAELPRLIDCSMVPEMAIDCSDTLLVAMHRLRRAFHSMPMTILSLCCS